MNLELSWMGAPLPEDTGRDEDIANGAELRALGIDVSESEGDEPYYNPQTKESGTKKKRFRVPGGIAAVAKQITVDYDSDDGRIIELKKQLYSDEYVAQKLREEGRMRYAPKTVGSRWLRLRKLLNEQEDERLDDELSDWHVGEDDTLKDVTEAVDKKYRSQFDKLEERKWREISLHLSDKLGKRKYTGKACQERHKGLHDGTALVPIELAEDQAERRVMRDERIRAAKQARLDAKQEVVDKDRRAKERAEARKVEKAEQNQKKVQKELQRRAEKEERLRINEERKTNKEKLRRRKLETLARMRAERDWQMARNRAEKELYRQLTGFNIDGRPVGGMGRTRKNRDGYESEEEEIYDELESDDAELELTDAEETEDEIEDEPEEELEEDPQEQSDAEEYDYENMGIENATDQEGDEDEDMEDSFGGVPVPVTPASRRRTTATPASKNRKTPASARGKTPAASRLRTPAYPDDEDAQGLPGGFLRVPVTKETLLNPRSVLTMDELGILLHFRELPRRGDDESHAEVVARLAHADETMKSDELSELLIHASEKSKGKKPEKVLRLQESDAKGSEAGQMGVKADDLDFMERYEGYQGEFAGVLAERRDSMMDVA